MAVSGKGTEEWRLGIEPGGHDGPEVHEQPDAVRDYSAERLERPLCVVTAEHLGWAMVACLALASRFSILGARPLDSSEARYALSELTLLRTGPPAGMHLTWVHLLEAAVFAALGAGDFGARIVFALSGLLLVATGFALRRHLGRAGGLAFAALITLSPSVAYFSRSADVVVPALAFAMFALALFLDLVDEPGRLLAAGLGAAAGLGVATGGAALMTALFMLGAIAMVGLVVALAGARVRLQVQVWWTRRKTLFLITTLVAAMVWLGCESDFFTHSPLYAIAAAFRSNFESAGRRGFVAGLDFYLPMLSLYEFLVVLLALIGALGVLTLRIRSRLATGALIWSALAVAFYLWTPARSPAFVLEMIVPMALLGAFVIQYLHYSIAWAIISYPLAALALLTLYIQVANNFVWYAPDASQAPWARTALLFWTEPATTLQTPAQCARARGTLPPARASAFFATDSPVLRWYLRALAPAAKADGAVAIVGGVEPVSLLEAQGLTTYEFELSDVWHPAWRLLSPATALHYLLGARVWTPLESHRVTIAVRPTITVAPTVIFAPVEPPAESNAPAEPSGPAASDATSPAESSAPAASDATSPAEPSAATPAEPSTAATPAPAPANNPTGVPASDPAGNPGADAPANGPG